VAVYGAGGKRWALTERGHRALERTPGRLRIGPSTLAWDGSALTVRFDEVTVPLPSRLRGSVRVQPAALVNRAFVLDDAGRHRWRPMAPCAHAEVVLERPALSWAGRAYLDTNAGDEPLEDAFFGWDWSRAALRRGTAVLYDVHRRSGGRLALALRFDPAGSVEPFPPPPGVRLPCGRWRVERATRAEPGAAAPAVLETLEDTPFYARSLVSTTLFGEPVTAVHESLSLERFRAAWVRMLLPFRMPRAWR